MPRSSRGTGFEFRTLAAYLAGLAQSTSTADADAFVRDYLQVKSLYHERMAQFLTEAAPESSERLAARGGLAAREVRQRLAKAAAFSDRLATLMRNADASVRALERALMSFRQCIFEHRPQEAHALRLTRVRHDPSR